MEKRNKNDKIEISGLIFILTTWKYKSGHKITSPKLSSKNLVKQLIGPFSVSNTHRERLVFHSIQYRNTWLAASDFFDMFTQSIKFYIYILLSVQMFEKYDSSNRQ